MVLQIGKKLTRAEKTLKMRSMMGTWDSQGPLGSQLKNFVDSVPSNIVYLRLRSPITLSTWILTRAIPSDCSTSTGSSWFFPFLKAGITSLPCLSLTLSEIVEPLSAITVSPGSNLSKIPQFSVRNLSDIRPPQASDTKDTVPCGVIYTNKNFHGVMIFVWGERLGSGQQIRWFVNKHFEAIDDHNHPLTKCVMKTHRRSFP